MKITFFGINLSFTTYTHAQLGRTAVYCASKEGHSEVVKLLVQAGADLELQHKVYITIIMINMEVVFPAACKYNVFSYK